MLVRLADLRNLGYNTSNRAAFLTVATHFLFNSALMNDAFHETEKERIVGYLRILSEFVAGKLSVKSLCVWIWKGWNSN